MPLPPVQKWTNPSVLGFAKDRDPIQAMMERARGVVAAALDHGWAGPPFDPIALAQLMGLQVIPREDVRDARTVAESASRVRIEFNPTRAPNRVRYSVAHEIAHTLFPDVAAKTRHRARRSEMLADDWQLEMLCNIGAAELLMPAGSLPRLSPEEMEIGRLMRLRDRFSVSSEAMFIRVAQSMTSASCAAFCASKREHVPTRAVWRLDYLIPSPMWRLSPEVLPKLAATAMERCLVPGDVVSADEDWGIGTPVHVEAIAIPAYYGATSARVAGIAYPVEGLVAEDEVALRYVRGDATNPYGVGPKVVAQIVNDATPTWGASGFASAVRRRWPVAQRDFRDWCHHHPSNRALGRSRLVHVEQDLAVFSMVAQHGYGPSLRPRIRYASLAKTLKNLGLAAAEKGATVHMPRIGTGQAGGDWDVVHDMIIEHVCSAGVRVFVYDLPGTPPRSVVQESLPLGWPSRPKP